LREGRERKEERGRRREEGGEERGKEGVGHSFREVAYQY
jgi:hypothetical protein